MASHASASSSQDLAFVPLPHPLAIPTVSVLYRVGGPCYEGHDVDPASPCSCMPDREQPTFAQLEDTFPRVTRICVPASIETTEEITRYVADAFPVEVTARSCQFEDEYTLMLHDELREGTLYLVPASLADGAASSPSPVANKKLMLGFAIDARRNCPFVLSRATIERNRSKFYAASDLAERPELVEFEGGAARLKEDAVWKAFELCKTLLVPNILPDTYKPSMPYPVEYTVLQQDAAKMLISVDGNKCTVLEAIADLLHSKGVGGVKLVGNVREYHVCSNFVMDWATMWPVDRMLCRVVINLGDPSLSHDYVGRTMKGQFDRALNNLLVPVMAPVVNYDGPKEVSASRADLVGDGVNELHPKLDSVMFIDSFADVVSTLTAAFFNTTEEERAAFRAQTSWASKKMLLLAGHPDERISGLFTALFDIFYYLAGTTPEHIETGLASLQLIFILANAYDIAKFRSRSRRLLKVLLSHNACVQQLQEMNILRVARDRLPFTGGMDEEYVKEIVEELNEALNNRVEKIPVP